MIRSVLPWIVLGGAACARAAEPIPVADHAMPTLHQVEVAADLEAVGGVSTVVVVGPQGTILTRPVPGAPYALSLHLPDIGWIGIGTVGEGPGEVRLGLPLAVSDSVVWAWDLARLQLVTWSLDGTWREAIRTDGAASPYLVVPGRGVVALVERREGSVPVLLDPEHGATTDLLPSLDSTYRRVFPETPGFAQRFGNPAAVGQWAGGFLMGNGFSYQLIAYDWTGRPRFTFGRTLATNRRTPAQVERQVARLRENPVRVDEVVIEQTRRRLAQDSTRWFSHLSPPAADARGRVWIVGLDGDRPFADLFADAEYLGRLRPECPGFEGRWAVNNTWLAMLCLPDDPEDMRDAVVRLYRIDG